MRIVTGILVFLLCVTALQAEWNVLESYEIYPHASGLAWDGTYIYSGVYGADGGDIYRIDPSDGSYTYECTGPQGDSFGLTWDGEYLWCTDHGTPTAEPAHAIQFDLNGVEQQQFDLPDHYMSGIAYDDGDFWVATYYDPDGYIYKIDNTGQILDSFSAPDAQPWDLCMQGDTLWVADYWGNTLYKIDAASLTLLESHAAESDDVGGVVFDGQYLWYTDNGPDGSIGNDWLYKVDIGAGPPPETCTLTIHLTTNDSGNPGGAALTLTMWGTGEQISDTFPVSGNLIVPDLALGMWELDIELIDYQPINSTLALTEDRYIEYELETIRPPVTDLVAHQYGNNVVLDWTPPQNVGADFGVNIVRERNETEIVVLESLWTEDPPFYDVIHESGSYAYGVSGVYPTGLSETVWVQLPEVATNDDTPPLTTALHGAHPNPFNPSTVFSFSLAAPGRAELQIYDARGRLARTLDAGNLEAGQHGLEWDGKLDSGHSAASGVYFGRLMVDNFSVDIKRCVLLK